MGNTCPQGTLLEYLQVGLVAPLIAAPAALRLFVSKSFLPMAICLPVGALNYFVSWGLPSGCFLSLPPPQQHHYDPKRGEKAEALDC